jgi:hypothetical protein
MKQITALLKEILENKEEKIKHVTAKTTLKYDNKS